jgi:hypothetical protein
MNPWIKIFPALNHFSAVLCEKVLTEFDQVCSAIRIVDVFHINQRPGGQTVIEMKVLALGRFSDDAEDKTYSLNFEIRGPNGKSVTGNEPVLLSAVKRYPDVPGGFATEAAIGLIVTQLGTHKVVVTIDGVEIAHVPFTVRPASVSADE